MNPVDPVSSSQASSASAVTSVFSPPSSARVTAFESLINSDAIEGQIFGNSAIKASSDPSNVAPVFATPPLFDYLGGAMNSLDRMFPSLPSHIPSPSEMFSAQLQASATQLSWQLTGKLVGTSVQGLNTLVNSQV